MLRIRSFAFSLVLILLFVSSTAFGQQWSGVLNASRATDWTQAGIPGGIPSGSWSQCGATIAAYGSSGGYASPSSIISAISACSGSSKYVLLGPGDFYLNAAIRSVGVHNVELRGSGPTQTRIHFSSGSICQGGNGTCLVGFESSDGTYANGVGGNYFSWTSGYAQGVTSITLSSGANIRANSTMLVLDQCDTGYSGSPCSGAAKDNGNFFNCSDAYNASGPTGCSFNAADNVGARTHRYQQEMVQVTSCSPACGSSGTTTVTISPGLHHANWASGQTPQAWLIQPAQYVGVTNLTVDGTNTGYSSATAGVSFSNDAYYWMKNVELNSLPNISLYIISSMHGDIESNYIYNSGQSNASTDNSGINWYGADNLITNNICQNCHLAIIAGTTNSGNVISYNYLINAFTGNDTMFGDIWPGHANGSDYNLYEGNVADMYDTDQTHGTQLMDTLYRNFFTGWESCANGNCGSNKFKTSDLFGIMDLSFNRYQNIIGNVIGTPKINTLGYEFTNPEYFYYNGSGLGYPLNWESGNETTPPNTAGGPLPIDPVVGTTGMLWGNWDAFHGSTQWNSSEVPSGISVYPNPVPTSCASGGSCPPSFYLPSRPSWWSSSIPFPAIGPDVSNGNVGQCSGTLNTPGEFAGVAATTNAQCKGTSLTSAWSGHINAIPAMNCYLSVMGGPPDGTGGALTFDPANCYGATTASGPPPAPSNLSGTVVQ